MYRPVTPITYRGGEIQAFQHEPATDYVRQDEEYKIQISVNPRTPEVLEQGIFTKKINPVIATVGNILLHVQWKYIITRS